MLAKQMLKIRLIFFTIEIQEFRKIIDEFIGIAETIVSDVEQEKSRAIAAQNLLKSMSKQREAEQQDIQVSEMSLRMNPNISMAALIVNGDISEWNPWKNNGTGTAESAVAILTTNWSQSTRANRKLLWESVDPGRKWTPKYFSYFPCIFLCSYDWK